MINMDDLRGVAIKSEETSRTILAYNGALQAKGRGVEYPEAEPASTAGVSAMQARHVVSDMVTPSQQCQGMSTPTYNGVEAVSDGAKNSTDDQHRRDLSAYGLGEQTLSSGAECDSGSTDCVTAQPASQFWWDRSHHQDQQPFVINPFQESELDELLLSEFPMDQTLFEDDQAKMLDFFALDNTFAS